MAIVARVNDKEYRGDNVTVEGTILKVWTEPHEVKPGGLVDPFVGTIVALSPGDVVTVRRI
jgi:hypothetical protein